MRRLVGTTHGYQMGVGVDPWSDLRIVEVAELPGFHNPFKCDRREIFDLAIRDQVSARRRSWQIWKPSVDKLIESLSVQDTEQITRAARDHLEPDQVQTCRQRCAYHHPDWRNVAAAATSLVQTHGAELEDEMIERAVGEVPKPDQWSLRSLFLEPIYWHPTSKTLSNGQHRACGLVLSGAYLVPIAPGPARLESEQLAQRR